MSTATISPANSTTVRSSDLGLTLLRAYFGVTSRLLPGLARRQAERLFTRPPRYAGRQTEPVPARRETVIAGAHRLAVWQAGPAEAPGVLLSHGWGGRGVQMARFVQPLLERGYRVVWFDQPGHGETGNGPVGLPDLTAALTALSSTHGPFVAAVGHSLGAAALGLALRGGLALQRVVFVCPPASLREHTHNFARYLHISPRVREAMRKRLERRYDLRFDQIDRIQELGDVNIPALFVHDNDDDQIPIEHTMRLSAHMARARVIRTHGLGHHRILRHADVVRAVAAFIAGEDVALPTELPALPEPAPLY
ncbi:MAG: alpha/beta fold hydrolase [Rhodocyclales bacterium]|nr:alpha/beta fold hydrolase [Rhodocyclales bacterium]